MQVDEIIESALLEDIGDGDHSSLACVPENANGKATLYVKDDGILAGVDLAVRIFRKYDPSLNVDVRILDGTPVKKGDIAFTVTGSSRSILATERLVLNFMQRMSGIATQTNKIVSLLEGTNTRLLDTRKTTPCIRYMEKWAVRIGGGENHRFALYDMIMLKDNHIDSSGGITVAVRKTKEFLSQNNLDLKIEVETRNMEEVNEALNAGVDRIMLDNFNPDQCKVAVDFINNQCETEASGGIGLHNLKEYALSGVTYISLGYFTHSVKALDISFKTKFKS